MRYLDICETGNGPELKGNYGLLAFDGKVAVITYSDINTPSNVYTVVFTDGDKAGSLADIKVSVG